MRELASPTFEVPSLVYRWQVALSTIRVTYYILQRKVACTSPHLAQFSRTLCLLESSVGPQILILLADIIQRAAFEYRGQQARHCLGTGLLSLRLRLTDSLVRVPLRARLCMATG